MKIEEENFQENRSYGHSILTCVIKCDDELHNEWGLGIITSFWKTTDNIYLQAGFSFGMENTLGEFDEIYRIKFRCVDSAFQDTKSQPPSPNLNSNPSTANTCREPKLHGSRNSIYSPQPKRKMASTRTMDEYGYCAYTLTFLCPVIRAIKQWVVWTEFCYLIMPL